MRLEKPKKRDRTLWFYLFFLFPLLAAAVDTQTVITPNPSGGTPTQSTQIIVPNAPRTPTAPFTAPSPAPPAAQQNVIPTPNAANPPISYGRFRNQDGTAKVGDMMLDRFKESVVRITVKDHAGNTLSKAMGVSVGKDQTYVATTLSLLLGNAIQWGDQLAIEHYGGNVYGAEIALIDEQMDLVLLQPENMPPPIQLVRTDDERSGVGVFTLGLDDRKRVSEEGAANTVLEPRIFRGTLAAVNPTAGSLSVSKEVSENSYAGTAIINMQGELLGMLLPNGKGVLASYLRQALQKATKGKPLPVRMLGAIMGRGVLVDPSVPEAYQTISDAIKAIRAKEAPKANTALFNPAKVRDLAPKRVSRVVLKVMPGIYREKQTISLPSQISFTGAGPSETILLQDSPNTPVVKIEDTRNTSITGFRIIPAALQGSEVATVLINRSRGSIVLGNVIEGKGGIALDIRKGTEIGIYGNTFPKGKSRAVNCRESQIDVEANGFLGDWPQAISSDLGCKSKVSRNLFIETQIGVALSGQSVSTMITKNTFLRAVAGIRYFGTPLPAEVQDNIFSEGVYSFFSTADINPNRLGRNHVWKNMAYAKSKQVRSSESVRVEPAFENPENYDFRPRLRNASTGSLGGSSDANASDMGAYQRADFLGKYTSYFISSLEVATGQSKLADAWGYK